MYVCGVSLRFFAHSISVARSPAGRKLVRSRQPVANLPQQQRLRREDSARIAREASKQRKGGGVEGRRAHALHAEAGQPRPQLARRLVGERHRDEVRRGERAARHLPGDPAGDRRRLARACSGKDADRPARRFDRGALLRVQPGEDSLGVQGPTTVPGGSAGFVTASCRTRSRFGWRTIEPSFATTSSVSPSSASCSSSISCCASQSASTGAPAQPQDLRMIGRSGGLALSPQLLVQLLAGPSPDEFDRDVVQPGLAIRRQPRLLAREADHVAREVEDLHGLAHVEHEDLAARRRWRPPGRRATPPPESS